MFDCLFPTMLTIKYTLLAFQMGNSEGQINPRSKRGDNITYKAKGSKKSYPGKIRIVGTFSECEDYVLQSEATDVTMSYVDDSAASESDSESEKGEAFNNNMKSRKVNSIKYARITLTFLIFSEQQKFQTWINSNAENGLIFRPSLRTWINSNAENGLIFRPRVRTCIKCNARSIGLIFRPRLRTCIKCNARTASPIWLIFRPWINSNSSSQRYIY